MPITRYEPDYDLQEERLERLRTLFPEAFADGELDWDALRDLLGAPLEEGDEYNTYGLSWPGKRAARRAAALPPRDALAPAPGEGVDEETTRNVFIEGDNLEVLKLLRKAYAGRVKMIYIDPPYNGGTDKIYQDDYSMTETDYLTRTGQIDAFGKRLITNTRTGGRYHTNWLSMIYPRLAVARDLLSSDGAICISIDDDELHNLVGILQELFGPENAVAVMPWRGRGGRQDSAHLANVHEYVVLFAKDPAQFEAGGMPVQDEGYSRVHQESGRRYKRQLLRKWGSNSRRQDRPNLFYSITAPDGLDTYPLLPDGTDGRWRWGPARMEREIAAGNVEFERDEERWVAYEILWAPSDGEQRSRKYSSWLDDVGTTAAGTKELQTLFGGTTPFDYPKPTSLIKRLVQIVGVDDDEIVLDFFAGSCTTGHAIWSLNREDGGTRRHLVIQLPEPVDPDRQSGQVALQLGLSDIAQIGRERLRRASTAVGHIDSEGLEETAPDLGFHVIRQVPSNYRRWRDYEGQSVSDLQSQLAGFTSPLVEGWDPVALRTEVMLAQGFPLDSRIARCDALPHNAVDVISHEWCEHRLWVCLDEYLAPETVHALSTSAGGYKPEDVFVCLDSALSDEARARLDDRCHVVII